MTREQRQEAIRLLPQGELAWSIARGVKGSPDSCRLFTARTNLPKLELGSFSFSHSGSAVSWLPDRFSDCNCVSWPSHSGNSVSFSDSGRKKLQLRSSSFAPDRRAASIFCSAFR